MKKTANILIAAFLAISAYGVLKASDFETDLNNIENKSAVAAVNPVSPPAPANSGTRWWSVAFFGSAHNAITKAALSFTNKTEFPDIGRANSVLMTGGSDESGHPNSAANGGLTKDLWYGKTPASKGGVLYNYEQFDSTSAYERLGIICHLTQDQAVPTHAANIKHSTGDSFEGWPSWDNKVNISASRYNADIEPYAYYQQVQDETRSHLSQWVNPATGKPYWVPADNAPPLGQDITYGPWGHYGGDRNSDLWAVPEQSNNSDGGNNNNKWITATPEIRFRQLAEAGAATVAVLESASKKLPPLVANLSVSPKTVRAGEAVYIKFTALDNRSNEVTYKLNVYRDGVLQGVALQGIMALKNPASGDIMLSAATAAVWMPEINGRPMAPGKYVLELSLTDGDGNITPDEVNLDSNPLNDTKTALTVN
ncbi:MAG: hypothetical protein NTX59_11075 [Elusimicrobia bacterium]|nr:hypothetical protein [Elusimicrobiota bacterium]